MIYSRDTVPTVSFHNAGCPLASAVWIFKGKFPSSSSSFASAIIALSLSLSLSIYATVTIMLAVRKTIFRELINLY